MGVLSSNQLRARLTQGPVEDRLIVTPLLDMDLQVGASSGSIDVRLGSVFNSAMRTRQSEADPSLGQDGLDMERYYVPLGDYFVLHPRHFALGETLEYLCFPNDLAAYVVGRSSLGRQGLVIATAVGIHPNFRGTLTLELTNLGEIPIKLYPGIRVAQLFVHTMDQPAESSVNLGKFIGATGPEFGSPDTDYVMKRIRQLAEARRRRHGDSTIPGD